MKPPPALTDGVVVLRELREDDRAVVLSTMRDPSSRVAEHARGAGRPRLRRAPARRAGRESGDRIDYTVTEAGEDVALGAVIASRRHRDNYEIAYLAARRGEGAA